MVKSMIILGAGMVGSVMAEDLCDDAGRSVTIVDIDPVRLERVDTRTEGRVKTAIVDLSNTAAIASAIEQADIVLGAMPSRFGLAALRTVIESGKPCCDITFMPEDAWVLNELAMERGTLALFDCGVAPGMSNLLAAVVAQRLDDCQRIEIAVGGIPKHPQPPWNYKAAFSPFDVVEEYTRPTRLIEHGKLVICEALTDPEAFHFEGVGTLESVNTDGLRSLIETVDVPNMRERTLRWPGHFDLVRTLRETGLFDNEPIDVAGVKVVPRDVTCAKMFQVWTYEEGEPDITVMRVWGEGTLEGVPTRLTWDLFDEYDPVKRQTSMARTTAFPCTLCARMVERGLIHEPGVYSMERLADDPAVLADLLDGLAARGVTYREYHAEQPC